MLGTQRHRLALELQPVFIGHALLLDSFAQPAYCFKDGLFQKAINADEIITSEFISQYAQNYSSEIFVSKEDAHLLKDKVKEEITKLSRSLSVGNIQKNAIKHANLLTMQMASLYEDPFNDNLLNNQFQSSKNLGSMLLNNQSVHKSLFENISQSQYHYTFKQPLLSSILLLSFSQSLGGFNEKEVQNLFLTSYFKDIGMSFIPREKFELAHLSDFDKKIFAEHAEYSMRILENRLPLSATQLNMIKNHHYLNYKIQSYLSDNKTQENDEFLSGIESALLSSLDILVAMTHDRPYRKALTTFQALELLKTVLSDEYPQEFKALVVFLKNFYSK